jgi:hypothetical protein
MRHGVVVIVNVLVLVTLNVDSLNAIFPRNCISRVAKFPLPCHDAWYCGLAGLLVSTKRKRAVDALNETSIGSRGSHWPGYL